MEATEFDEEELFTVIARSGVRALLIGRRAVVALGILSGRLPARTASSYASRMPGPAE